MRTEFEIKQGDALTVLRTLPSESVQACITSPPYFGLRSYKTVPQIWDGDESCSHVWGADLKYAKQDNRSPDLKASQGATVGNSVSSIGFAVGTSGNFCRLCNAWRGELGLEPTFHLYISHLLQIFAEVKRVLKKDGCCFVNLGDSYNGAKVGNTEIHKNPNLANGTDRRKELQKGLRAKSLMNIPHRFFIGMTDELQMIQRNNINWWKRACMPSSATDRWTVDFESIGFFTKNAKYKFNQQFEPFQSSASEIARQYSNGFKETDYATNKKYSGGVGYGSEARNARTTWDIGFEPSGDAHYASYPTKLVETMILASTDEGDTVLDIFTGTGTTLLTALRHKRNALGIELQPDYIKIAEKRLREVSVKLF